MTTVYCYSYKMIGLGLWCLTPLQLYLSGQFYWRRKLDKTTDLPQVTTNKMLFNLPSTIFQ